MLVGMAGADIIDVLAQRIIELRRIETVGCLEELRLLIRIGNHLRKTGERFTHTSHLTGDIHVPHLIAVARLGSALILGTVLLHISAVVHAVPYPESHILGDEECLVADFLIIKVGSDVYQTGKLLVYAVIRCPNPIGVVVGTIHLDKSTMLSRNGVDIAVTILFRMLLILIKSSPGSLHIPEFSLRSEITSLPVALQLLIIYKGHLLILSQLIHHSGDVLTEDGFLLRIGCHGVCLCDCRHIVTRAMSLEFGIRRIPAIALGIALGTESVGIAIVVELLGNIPGTDLTDSLITVVGESIVTIYAHISEREGMSHFLFRSLIASSHHLHLCLDRITIVGSLITYHKTTNLILASGRMLLRISLSLLISKRRVSPAYLAIL